MPDTLFNRWVCLAEIGKPKGIKGVVSLKLCNEVSSYFEPPLELWQEDLKTSWHIVDVFPTNKGIDVKIAGIDTRNQAEGIRGLKLGVWRSSLPQLAEEHYYHHDLIGAKLIYQDKRLGEVIHIDNFGASDLLLVKTDNAQIYIPFLKTTITKVDLQQKTLELDKEAYAVYFHEIE